MIFLFYAIRFRSGYILIFHLPLDALLILLADLVPVFLSRL